LLFEQPANTQTLFKQKSGGCPLFKNAYRPNRQANYNYVLFLCQLSTKYLLHAKLLLRWSEPDDPTKVCDLRQAL